MSLIDEALKRAQSAGEGGAAQPGERPWSPPPMPDAGRAREVRLRRVAGAALLTVAAAGAAYLALRREPPAASNSPAQPVTRPLAPTSAPVAVDAAPTAFPVSVVPTPPISRPSAAVLGRSGDEGTGTGSPEAATAVEVPALRPQRLVSGKTYAGSVALAEGARIELGGIVWSETAPRALLNDRVLGVGAYVEGFTVVSIETERVELRKDDLTIFLSVK